MLEYVSNAGIIFNIEGKKIGVDCLCRDSAKLYQDTPIEIREELRLDVLIFTHEHEDHFCAEYVKEVWEENPELQIYSTKKVVESLAQLDIPHINLNEVWDGDKLEVDNIYIDFIETVHEGEQYVKVKNLTILINKAGENLVVTGDAMPCKELFERIAAWSPRIDWLFVPFPYVGLRSTRKLMEEYLYIKNIFVLHQPRKEADAQNWVDSTKRLCEVAKDGLPTPVFPDELGEWYSI